ncbi:hypothetical protein ACEPAI_8338 [Sanghuangporus weigelae]
MDTILGMFGDGEGFTPFSESRAQEHYRDMYLSDQPKHEANWTHEAIAAAAGFAAMHAYESHLRATGQPVSHGKMKEILAAIAAAEVDKLAETKGLDWVDRHRAKKLAEQQAHALATERYGEYNTGWEYASAQQGPAREYDFYGGAPWGSQGCPNYGWYDQRYGAPGGYAGGGGYGGGYSRGYGGGGYEGGYGGGGYTGGYPPAGGYPQEQGYGGGGYAQEYYRGY